MLDLGEVWELRVDMNLNDDFKNLKEYIKLMEEFLTKEKKDREENPSAIPNGDPNDEFYQMYIDSLADEYYMEIDKYENIFPQIIRRTFLMNLWSIFEMYIKIFSKKLENEANIPITIKNLSGDLLERIKYYFERLGGINITTCSEWEAINYLKDIRNFIIHTPEYTSTDSKRWKKVKLFIDNNPSLISSNTNMRIEIKEKFSNYALEKIQTFLSSLFSQIR